MTSKPFTTCLWYDDQGEDAARFYTGIFKNSRIGSVNRYSEAGPGPEGAVFTVEFELNGQKFLALNGGQGNENAGFTDGVSLMVECEDQAEVDYYWDRLTEGGREVACGWLTDKYGFRWQIIPSAFYAMMSDPDQAKVARVMAAMMKMTKFDIAALERAYAGD
jgi:predicted 3-demethylubiquinone-9 3-methyltransferase (glyoxalase superfamily)